MKNLFLNKKIFRFNGIIKYRESYIPTQSGTKKLDVYKPYKKRNVRNKLYKRKSNYTSSPFDLACFQKSHFLNIYILQIIYCFYYSL